MSSGICFRGLGESSWDILRAFNHLLPDIFEPVFHPAGCAQCLQGSNLTRGSWYHMDGLLQCACGACSHFVEAYGSMLMGNLNTLEELCSLAE